MAACNNGYIQQQHTLQLMSYMGFKAITCKDQRCYTALLHYALWLQIYQNKSGIIRTPMVSTYLAIGFNIFILSLEFLPGVENSTCIALQTQIYLITNRLGSWQAKGGSYATFVGSLIVQIKSHNFKVLPTLLRFRRSCSWFCNRTSCSCHAFIQFRLECGKT